MRSSRRLPSLPVSAFTSARERRERRTGAGVRDGALERRAERVLLHVLDEDRLDAEDGARDDLLDDGLREDGQQQVEAVVGLDCSGLGFEGDVELLDTCEGQSVSSTRILRGAYTCTGRTDSPSSFLSTRSTAPEQPPQLMLMLNL